MAVDLAHYDDNFLTCRDLRHSWTVDGYYRGSLDGIHRWLTCTRCGTERHDHWLYGRTNRKYDYVDGYLLGEKVEISDVRNVIFAKATIHESLNTLRKSKTQRRSSAPRKATPGGPG